jgi:hypothetical protein
MIVFDLSCLPGDHRFEGWFASSAAFREQSARGLVTCPQCGSAEVSKAAMAPSLGRKGNQLAAQTKPAAPTPVAKLPPALHEAMVKMAALQTHALQQSTWVGDQFAAQSRAIHYGERDEATIHGQATLTEASELIEEGIAIMPLPFPVPPPDEVN